MMNFREALFGYLGKMGTLVVLGAVFGCTSSPRGAPPTERALNAASDALAVGKAPTGQASMPGPNAHLANQTRIEISHRGLMSCLSVSPSSLTIEIVSDAPEGVAPAFIAGGALNATGDAVLNGLIASGLTYRFVLRTRRGDVFQQSTFRYAGNTPWRVSLNGSCPD